MGLCNIAVDKLYPHPDNPRKDLGDLTELADSIKANGILQNLTVVRWDGPEEGYTVIIGHRRLAAAKLAGEAEVPCAVVEMSPQEQVRTMMIENMQRSDLTIYEQAQGFQMMLDLGGTVESVARDTGFSEATVRRRVKMMELDQMKLKEVSTRQLSLSDFDKLAEIKDIKARNKCLDAIGTENFAEKVETSLRRQEIKKKLPAVQKALESAKAKPLEKASDKYSGKYNQLYGHNVTICKWNGTDPIIPENAQGQLYYWLDDAYGTLSFYTKRQKAASVKKTPEEIEREKKIEDAHAALSEKTAVAYGLRRDFVAGLSCGAKNEAATLRGALIARTVSFTNYIERNDDAVFEILALDQTVYGPERGMAAVDALRKLDKQAIPGLIYALFGDSDYNGFGSSSKQHFPVHKNNAALYGLYDWLTSLGYVMSDEEKALMDGTHELFRLGEAAQ